MSTIRADKIQVGYGQEDIPLEELTCRVVKSEYIIDTPGAFTPGTSYTWITGLFRDYTPLLSNTRIRMNLRFGYAFLDNHAITHMIFYANGIEQGRHNISGLYIEHRHTYMWEVGSWGAGINARIGYQARAYSTGNECRFHSTRHWDGTGTLQNTTYEIRIDEYIPL